MSYHFSCVHGCYMPVPIQEKNQTPASRLLPGKYFSSTINACPAGMIVIPFPLTSREPVRIAGWSG